jgi:hypothetical protein
MPSRLFPLNFLLLLWREKLSDSLPIVESKKRVLSAAGRAAIAKAARKRWAKVRKRAKKTVGREYRPEVCLSTMGQYESFPV